MAAVSPAGPLPMMMTSFTSPTDTPLRYTARDYQERLMVKTSLLPAPQGLRPAAQ